MYHEHKTEYQKYFSDAAKKPCLDIFFPFFFSFFHYFVICFDKE